MAKYKYVIGRDRTLNTTIPKINFLYASETVYESRDVASATNTNTKVTIILIQRENEQLL